MSKYPSRRDLLAGLGAALLIPTVGLAQTAPGTMAAGETVAERTACLLTTIAAHPLDLGLYFAQKFAHSKLISRQPLSEQFLENNREWGDRLVQGIVKGSIDLSPAETQDLDQLTLANDRQKDEAQYFVLSAFRVVRPDPNENRGLAGVCEVTKNLTNAGLTFSEPPADHRFKAFSYYCRFAGITPSSMAEIQQDKGFMRRFGDYAELLSSTRQTVIKIVEAGAGQCGALPDELAVNVRAIRHNIDGAARYANEKRYTNSLDVRQWLPPASPEARPIGVSAFNIGSQQGPNNYAGTYRVLSSLMNL